MKVLFICTGNICRSPMGELLLPQFMPDLESDSAGTRGLVSHEIAPNSKRLLDQHGIDSSSFRAKRVTPQIAQGSNLILCFEHEQRKEIAVIAPTAARKTERFDPPVDKNGNVGKNAGDGLRFGIVVTLRGMDGRNRFDEFKMQCQLQSEPWIVEEIDMNTNIKIYQEADAEITFDDETEK